MMSSQTFFAKIQEFFTRAKIQEYRSDILTASAHEAHHKDSANPYRSYQSAVKELARKYDGEAEYGNQIVQNVIDVRAAFTLGQGVKAIAKGDNADETLEFIQNFLDYNNFDEELPLQLATEAEIEGKCLLRIFIDEQGKVIVRHLSWTNLQYQVITDPADYNKIIRIEYTDKKTGNPTIIKPEEAVYLQFGGRLGQKNVSPPKTAKALRNCEDLDKALMDWRKINHLFASPTPYFKTMNAEEAAKILESLPKLNWKIGKAFAGTADFSLVSLDRQGVESLEKEITRHAQIISGQTGIPIHFLGFPELMSNRSTAESLIDMLLASTTRERKIWKGGFEELFQKVIRMEKIRSGFSLLDEQAVEADLPFISDQKMQELSSVWLPLYSAGVLSLKTMLSKIPEVDSEEEMRRLEEPPVNPIPQTATSSTESTSAI